MTTELLINALADWLRSCGYQPHVIGNYQPLIAFRYHTIYPAAPESDKLSIRTMTRKGGGRCWLVDLADPESEDRILQLLGPAAECEPLPTYKPLPDGDL